MKQRLRAIIGMLVTIFVLGMAENLLGTPAKDLSVAHNIFSGIILLLHVLTAIGILVVATQLMRQEASDAQKARLGRGFGSAGLAFVAGVLVMALPSPWSDICSFIMALGFIASLVFYGGALLHSDNTADVSYH